VCTSGTKRYTDLQGGRLLNYYYYAGSRASFNEIKVRII